MNRPYCWFPPVLLLLLQTAPAQEPGGSPPTHPDVIPDTSARTYSLDEIVVIATRRQLASSRASSGVTVVSHEAMEALPGTLLSSALSWTPGLSLRSYGGGASVQTISFRGMSPEHTLVLVDGQRYNSYQNGLADFGILSSASIDHVEVLRGGSSALYGSDAVGGVINVITRAPGEGIHGSASAMIGSNHSAASGLELEGGWGGFAVRGGIRREEGRDDYWFIFSDGKTETALRRSGEDYSVTGGDVRADWRATGSVRGFASLSYDDADRGSPGVVTDAASNGKGRLWDRLEYFRTGADWDALDGLTLRIKGTAHYGFEHYDDPGQLLNGAALHSLYTNRDQIVTPEALFNVSPWLSGSGGLEYARASLESSETLHALRIQRSVFLSTEHDVSLPWTVPFELIVYPSVRYDAYSDITGDVSPKVGLNVGLLREPSLRLRASYGKSFHAPVLNDLYWIEGGNPLLRPERSYAFDAGIRSTIELAGPLRLDISYFSIESSDRIVWVPASGTFWSPRNIASVTSHGLEASADWTGLNGMVRLSLNSTWTDATKESADFPGDPTEGKRLIYEPPQTFNAIAEVSPGPFRLLYRHSWIGYRYTTEINDRFLPAYSIESAAVSYLLSAGPFDLRIKVEAENLLNTSYQVVALYPMPLREYRVTMEAGL